MHYIFPKNARLGRGLVFDDEIAAQADTHPTEARSKAAGNFREAPSQPAISGKHQGSRQSRGSTRAVSGKRRPEQSKVEGPSGCRSRIGVGRAKGSEEKGIRRARGARRGKGQGG